MPGLIRSPAGELVHLVEVTDVGKLEGSFIQLASGYASRHHAKILWRDGVWHVLDFSRNGTWIDGARLWRDERAVRVGSQIRFGSADEGAWKVEEDGPPVALARCLVGGRVVVATVGALMLPDEEAPQATVFEAPDEQGVARWWLEQGDSARVVETGAVIALEQPWTLHLPPKQSSTTLVLGGPTVHNVELHFRPSRRGAHVAVWAEYDGERIDLGSNAFWPVVLPMVRRRLADRALPEHERGWMKKEEVMLESLTPLDQVDALVSKVRKHLEKNKIGDPAAIVQALPGRRRLGTDRIVLHEGEE